MDAEYIDITKYWMAINSVVGIGARTIKKLVEKFGSLRNVFLAEAKEITLLTGINFDLSCKIVNLNRELPGYEKLILQMYNSGIKILCPDNPEYPYLLRYTNDQPSIIYKRGNISLNDIKTISIVGTRFPSEKGYEYAEEIAFRLAEKSFAIVSGLARGIDTAAHIGALKANGKTIAVIGSGLKMIYPEENQELAETIGYKGAIISECHPNEKVSKRRLIQRNRITSGISLGVIVIEPENGSLNTAQWALKYNKHVLIYDIKKSLHKKIKTLPKNVIISDDLDEIDYIIEKINNPDLPVFAENEIQMKLF